jgi:hypothetical protein
MQSGVFLSKDLYVHRQVWDMKTVKIIMIDHKIRLFKDLRKEFQRVRIYKAQSQVTTKQVENLLV